jgi:hypothetical protein
MLVRKAISLRSVRKRRSRAIHFTQTLRNRDQIITLHDRTPMKPETRAKKDKCTLVASVDHGKLRVLGGV